MSNSYLFDFPQLEQVTAGFDPSIASSTYVTYLTDRVNTLKKVQVGQPFVDFTLNTPEGEPLALSTIVANGGYVLVDFWAAWCAPCRQENPNLVKAYDLYHNKGFQIYQVSLDKTSEDWIKGIQDDRLEKWIHVSDIKYWNSIVVPLYKIESIPTNFLLDREGKIIASNLRGEQLQIKLAELFNK